MQLTAGIKNFFLQMKDLFPSTKSSHENKELFVFMGVLLLTNKYSFCDPRNFNRFISSTLYLSVINFESGFTGLQSTSSI